MSTTPPFDYSPIVERDYDLPDGTRLAAWVILNVEHFRYDLPYREGDPVPDSKGHGRREYGTRVGYWRLQEILDDHSVPATLALNSEVCDHEPAVVEAAVERDWAIMGHGRTNSRRLVGMDRRTAEREIRETRDRIERFTGSPPAGWLSPGLQHTAETPELLEETGFSYVCDWCADDQPFELADLDLVTVPYSLDLNDTRLFRSSGYTGPQYRDAILDAADTLAAEGNRVLPIPLHPYITGQSFRAPHFEAVLAELVDREDVWLTTGDELASHFRGE
ncbi:MAG: polysaccharide deacetylase family protein [Haloferacaceae archaeon]